MTRIETISIVHNPPRILLGLKNPAKKFGGKWNGFGGGIENGENLEECAKRETYDETGINIKNLEKRGKILFRFETDEQNHKVHIYKIIDYEGIPKYSKDFIGYAWFHEKNLPTDNMMPADKYWLPFFVKGIMFKGKVLFDKEFKNPKAEIYGVNSLD